MVRANFSAYGAYVTDSLHQWDINRTLQVTGLNLRVIPEVHFSNNNMKAAIVRQATLDGDMVRAEIPNSLLQQPLRIIAHIGIYEGRAFKVVETVELPVIPRKRPEDYEVEDSDEEIYSFKRLENEVANMVTRAQFANLVAGVGSDAELVDVRYSVAGVSYASAGEAVRGQVLAGRNAVQYAFDNSLADDVIDTELTGGYINTVGALNAPSPSLMEVTTKDIKLQPGDILRFEVRCTTPAGLTDWVEASFYDATGSFVGRHELQAKELYISNDGAYSSVRFSGRTFGTPCVIVSRKNMAAISDQLHREHRRHNYDSVPLTWRNGYYNVTGAVRVTPFSHTCEVRTDFIPVVEGEKYKLASWVYHDMGDVEGTGVYHWAAVAMYDQAGVFVSRALVYTVTENVQPYTIDEEILIPAGVSYIAICGRTYWTAKYSLVRIVEEAREYDTTVRAVAHRGYSIGAPENTLAAYRMAKRMGFNYAECDVSFTSDSVAVLLHDDTIDRTSNGAGSISAKTYAEVKELDFGSWFSSAYAGEHAPTFEEFLSLCRSIGLRPYVELKAGTEEQIKSIVDTVIRYGMRDKTTWISFSAAHLAFVKDKDDHARLGLVVGEVTSSTISTAQSLQTEHNNVFIDCAHATAAAGAELCAAARIPLEVWTVNDVGTVKALDPYVSGVTSDNLVAGRVLYEANI